MRASTPGKPTFWRASAALVGVTSLFALAACGGANEATPGATTAPAPEASAATTPAAESASASPGATDADATAPLKNAEGADVGSATFNEADGTMQIEARVTGMEPGFYGFHIHGIGKCEPNSAAPNKPDETGAFLSAGGHLGADQGDHPEHKGDLPSLLVMQNGEAQLSFATDRVTLDDLTDEDGAVLMVHGGPDNFANIPERYAAGGPDEDSRGTGDAGSRLACGVIESGQ